MADNVAFSPGSGATGATDDIGGVHYPRVKMTWGVDGVAVDASATNPVPVVAADSSSTSGSVTSAATIFTLDTTGYEGVSVQVTSAGSATITYEASNDNTNWVTVNGVDSNNVNYHWVRSTTTVVGIFRFPKIARYFRARVSAYTSGTVSAIGMLLTAPMQHEIFARVDGGTNESVPISSSTPLVINGLESRTTSKSSVSSAFAVRAIATQDGRQIVRPHAIPENCISYAAASGGILNTTTAVTIFSAAGSNIRNYLVNLQISAEALTNATEVAIRDGAAGTVLWRTKIGTGGLTGGRDIRFEVPLRGSANTLMEVVTLSASGTGAVYVNAQGYVGP